MKKNSRFKKGAASFYIVAISTLILVIIAASFAAVIISEVTRTSNDDLAQSAYDSALAGVEDAKLAYYNYQSCLENNNCSEDIEGWIDAANAGSGNCDMVANMLGRVVQENEGVLVQEKSDAGNDMQQYYTCAIIKTILPDYRATLNGNNPAKVVRAKFDNSYGASEIESIRVSWQADSDDTAKKYSDLSKDGIFGTEAPVPPVISVGLVQTAKTFNLSDFEMTQGNRTDRGTLYLVPTDQSNLSETDSYNVASNGYIGENGFLKSNDKTTNNKPYAVYCDGDEFACSVTIELPEPVDPTGTGRSDETFAIVLSMPYADSSTDVKLEFCSDKNGCYVTGTTEVDGEVKQETTQVNLKNVQISIDSTGRANDLYRRVETRLEPADTAYPYPLYAIQVLGDDNGDSLIKKDLTPTCEWNFDGATGPKGLCDNT